MGWFRKFILKIVKEDINKNGVEIGKFKLSDLDGQFTITMEKEK